MKVGLIARCDDRGLGHITWEAHRNLQPDRTLVIDMGPLAKQFRQHPDRYPDGTVLQWVDGQLPEPQVREWLRGLDVVYSAETFYDWRLVRWAEQAGVATVLHVMPEFWRHHAEPELPMPTRLWAPTPWRLDKLPEGTRLVPVPVALDRLAEQREQPFVPADGQGGSLRVLHVAGHRAAADRNGTNLLLTALRSVREPMHVTMSSQDGRLPMGRTPRHVQLRNRLAGVANYWHLYDGHDLLVLPRRYGGLCLPAQEAMAAGLGLVMPDCEPNGWWPADLVPSTPGAQLRTQGGVLNTWAANPTGLARRLDQLAADPAEVAALRVAAWRWAMSHSWQALGDLWVAQLADAAGVPAPL